MGDLLKIYKKMIFIRKKTYDTGTSDIILYRIHVCDNIPVRDGDRKILQTRLT